MKSRVPIIIIIYVITFTACVSSPQGCTNKEESGLSQWSDAAFDNSCNIMNNPSLPKWILTPPQKKQYIYGIGTAATKELAKQQALINAAHQFSSHVKKVLLLNDSNGRNNAGSKIIDQVEEQVLYGTKFLNSYTDSQGNQWILVQAPLDCLLDATEWVLISHRLQVEAGTLTDSNEELLKQIQSLIDNLDTQLETNKVYYQASPSEPDDFVLVEPGSFLMGQPEEEDPLETGDQHRVEITKPFYMARYEVTQQLWEEITGISLKEQSRLSEYPGINGQDPHAPVYHISWLDAVAFCNALSIRRGLTPAYTKEGNRYSCNFDADGYRLPTEAEWEYASRGGHLSEEYTIYSGYDDIDKTGWYWLNSGDSPLEELYPDYYEATVLEENNGRVHPVGRKEPNLLGIFDMSGNVSEWCWDWFDESYYDISPETDPKGPRIGKEKVHRGGQWSFTARICRSAQRGFSPPEYRAPELGIRLVRTALD